MPLEQIRPALRLDSERPRRYASLLDYGDDDESSTHSPTEESGRYDWRQGSSSSLRRAPSTRKAEEMSLAKLGGVGGVTRSGSWGKSSIGLGSTGSSSDDANSPGSRCAKLYRSPHPLTEEDGAGPVPGVEASFRSTEGCSDFGGRAKPGSIGGSITSEAPSLSSRTSTSSSSAAAFSLRSVSNRNSTGSVSSTTSSAGSPSHGHAKPHPHGHHPDHHSDEVDDDDVEDDRRSGVSARIDASDSSTTASPRFERQDVRSKATTPDEPKADCDSVSDATYVPQEEVTCTQGPREGPGLAAALEQDSLRSSLADTASAVEASASLSLSHSSTAEASPLTAEGAEPPFLPSPSRSANAYVAVESRPQETSGDDQAIRPSLSLRMPSADGVEVGGGQPKTSGLDAAYEMSEALVSPSLALQPPAPRRHSGMFMLRSRSQLASHPSLQMSFANGGQGRAAARDRSKFASEWENAPFSVLEAWHRGDASGDLTRPPLSPRSMSMSLELAACRGAAFSESRFSGLALMPRPDSLDPASSSGGSSSGGGSADASAIRSPLSRSPVSTLGAVKVSPALAAASASIRRPSLSRSASVQGTNVFRTPTIEEWSRFLQSQGVTLPPGRHSRTGTNFSAASAQQLAARLGAAGISLGSGSRADLEVAEDDLDSEDSDDDLTAGVLEKLRQISMSRAASRSGSVMGEDLASLLEAEENKASSVSGLAASSSDPHSRFLPKLVSPRDSPSTSPSNIERSSARSPIYEATPRPTPDRLPALHSPTGRRRSSKDASDACALYSHGEHDQKSIDDFVILSEVGRGAYGLVKRAHIKGPDGLPTGDEVVIKYIIKSRILADCWRRHRMLGPIPIEIHVMDQLRRLPYHPPATLPPWSPYRARPVEEYRRRMEEQRAASLAAAGHAAQADADGDGKCKLAPAYEPQPQMSHPNLCKMLDFFEDYEFYYMVMPRFGTGQDLFDHVESAPQGLGTFEIRSIFGQVADALRFLHANNIVHRDIKDENVILDGDGNVQLIDFGSAAHVRPGRLFDTFSGTLDYAAAEILRGEKYAGQAQDVWALGVVGFVLLCGECPFWNGEEAIEGLVEGSRAEQTLRERNLLAQTEVASADDGSMEDIDETSVDPATWKLARRGGRAEPDGGGRIDDVVDLIARCLEVDPAYRPTAAQICEHRFLAGNGGWTGPQGWLTQAP
ncbi:serine/threonine protein kinase [Thecaphora frezii]